MTRTARERGCPGIGWRRKRPVALGLLVAVSAGLALAISAGPAAALPSNRPNVLLVVSDDQTPASFTRELMPNVFENVVDRGMIFRRGYVHTPLCCPSRSEIMTGLWGHNTAVDENNVPLERPTIVEALSDLGYRTMLAGKYLNSAPCSPRPEFDEWVCYGPKPSTYSMVNPTLNVNGTWTPFTGYTTDILAERVASFIASTPADQPFFAMYTPSSPHLPADDDRCANVAVSPARPPSFDENTLAGTKPAHMRRGPLTAAEIETLDADFTKMTQAVPCLDRSIGTLLDSLGPRQAETLVIYISDNGFMHGEHRRWNKKSPYEESVHVPFAVSYPPVGTSARSSDALVQSIDIAPTIAGLLGIEWGVDGRSLLPLLKETATSIRDGALIEYCHGASFPCLAKQIIQDKQLIVPSFVGLVRGDMKYVEYVSGERELYDLSQDRYELTNLAGLPAHVSVQAALAGHLKFLRGAQPPQTTIVSGPKGPVGARVFTFRYFTQSRAATYSCRLDRNGVAGPWSACNGQELQVGPLTDGSYVFRVAGTTEAGVADTTPATRSFTISSTGPDVTIDARPPADSATRTVLFRFSSRTAGVTFQCRLEAFGTRNAWQPCSAATGAAYGPLADGLWSFKVRTTDAAGAQTSRPAESLFRISVVGPSMAFDVHPQSPTLATSARFVFYPNELTIGSFSCRLDGGSAADCSTGSYTATGLADGQHILSVTATDVGGTAGTSSFLWTVDTTPPVLTYPLSPPAYTVWTGANFNFASNEASPSFYCKLNKGGGGFKLCPAETTYTGLTDGPHTFYGMVADEAGNFSAVVEDSWIQDTVLPTVTVADGPPAVTGSTTATFTLGSNEPGTFRCTSDGGTPFKCSSPYTRTDLADGSHTLSAVAVDEAGNRSLPQLSSWRVDTTAPAPVTGLAATLAAGSVSLAWVNPAAADLDHVRVVRKVGSEPADAADGILICTCSGASATDTAPPSATTYHYAAFAFDAVGNVAAPARALLSDTTPPTLTLSGGPAALTRDLSATFTLVSSESGTFECSSDGAAYAVCTSPAPFAGLAEGTHTFAAVAVDGAGNRSAPSTHSWRIDATPPPAVTNLSAVLGSVISLAWQNPVSTDLARVRIVRKAGSPPADANDGSVVFDGTGTTVTDARPPARTTYHYAAFALDAAGNAAAPARASAAGDDVYDRFVTDTGCGACTASFVGSELATAIGGGSDNVDSAFGERDLGGTQGLAGRIWIRDVVRLSLSGSIRGDLPVFQVLDVGGRVVFELVVDTNRALRLRSPSNGLRSSSIDSNLNVTMATNGTGARRIEVSALRNSSVTVRVDGVVRLDLTSLSGGTTGNPRRLRAGIIQYDTSSSSSASAFHSGVQTSPVDWLGP